ncbi:MAG: hypothetical protein U5N58_00775 [Actinomycetota bacterium]|nr:hypothetical protein [Actinomycetota bacterium]
MAELLTMSGSEVKKVEDTGKKFDKVVIGQITEYQPHPNADKLSLCRVKDGQGIR